MTLHKPGKEPVMIYIASFHFESRLLSVLTVEGETITHRSIETHQNPFTIVRDTLGLVLEEGGRWNLHPSGLTATLTEAPTDNAKRVDTFIDELEGSAVKCDPTIVAALIDFATYEVAHAESFRTGPTEADPAWGREDRARSIMRARGLDVSHVAVVA